MMNDPLVEMPSIEMPTKMHIRSRHGRKAGGGLVDRGDSRRWLDPTCVRLRDMVLVR